jgi:hypothetical protein
MEVQFERIHGGTEARTHLSFQEQEHGHLAGVRRRQSAAALVA